MVYSILFTFYSYICNIKHYQKYNVSGMMNLNGVTVEGDTDTMPFPNCEHTIYKKNTLQQVICQLRFPSILLIDAQIPAQFQERIRKQYPLFRERTESNKIPQEILSLLPSQMKAPLSSAKKFYDFASSDDSWVISLTRESIALTANSYTRWSDFKGRFRLAFDALVELYSPSFFSRIGLRYQNIIQRSALGIEETPWASLLKPYIIGPLNTDIADSVIGAFQTFEVLLNNDNSMARIQHGLVEAENGEQCYLIDSDIFTEQHTEVGDGVKILDEFNREGTRLFQWCISPALHEAMDPK